MGISYYGSVTNKDLSSKNSWLKWLPDHKTNEADNNDSLEYIGEGMRLFDDIHNLDKSYLKGVDDKKIKFPSYSDDVSTEEFGNFSGGYLPLLLRGADEKNYITMIDKKGKQAYEPIKLSDDIATGNYYFYKPEVLQFNTESTVLYFNGKAVYYDADSIFMIDTKGNKEELSIEAQEKLINYDEKYLYFDKGIYNLEQNEYLSIFIKTSDSDNDNSELDDEEASGEQKDYINIDNFSIIGKWKNVGTDTFGQAQKGAIISFNDTNCNFFSQKDTYAFYKDGDDYKLECTSPLADTVSFTVKIVDENNIDIINSSNTIELRRVN